MIQKFIERFENRKIELRERLSESHPESYKQLVRMVVEIITDDESCYDEPDPGRIHEIDDGDHQGTLVFVIADKSYQPSNYWYCLVGYGSCSGCDTLLRISEYSQNPPDEQQVSDYLTLCLHIVQRIGSMNGDEA